MTDVNSHGVNKAIKARIFSDEYMVNAGFRNNDKNFYFCRTHREKQPKKKCGYSIYTWEISFNVTIPKDGSDISIDVLDEAFCQPYDYQRMLECDPKFQPALEIQEFVEGHMATLQEKGILSGHQYGEYI